MTPNPFVTYLNRYTTVSSDHEAAFDEFIAQAEPPGEPLRLDTKTERFVRARFKEARPPSIILTGNAGDGKTYLARQIINAFTGQQIANWQDRLDYPIEREGHTLRVVKDLSEMSEEKGQAILKELAATLNEAHTETFLLAANEGRLRALLHDQSLAPLAVQIDQQLREGPALDNPDLIVLNLNRVTTSTYVPQVLEWITAPAHWEACASCPVRESCPIRFNAERLAHERIAERLQQLYRVLEQLGLHMTIRDMLIHLAYTVTAGQTCDAVQANHDTASWRWVYYESVWGEPADEVFQRKSLVIHHLRRLDVGQHSLFTVDDFIINGRPTVPQEQEEWDALFAPALDLGKTLFQQARDRYLKSGASPKREEHHDLIQQWLPHCRRKLYFEWSQEETIHRLFPFSSWPDYLRVIKGDRAHLKQVKGQLILALNRALTALFLTDQDKLFVTSQYAQAVEQPVPIIKLELAENQLELNIAAHEEQAYDNELTMLELTLYAPPKLQAEPIAWPINLLRFEYLMRRAQGATADVLQEECELAVRQLKDELLARFVVEEPADSHQIDFFVAEQRQYTKKTLWIDEKGKIRT